MRLALTRMITDRDRYEGVAIPRGFGVALYDPVRCEVRMAVIPLNWLIRWSTLLWRRLTKPPGTSQQWAYQIRFDAGRRAHEREEIVSALSRLPPRDLEGMVGQRKREAV